MMSVWSTVRVRAFGHQNKNVLLKMPLVHPKCLAWYAPVYETDCVRMNVSTGMTRSGSHAIHKKVQVRPPQRWRRRRLPALLLRYE